MKQIVVKDINVLVDLNTVGLLDAFLHLPSKVHITDFVMSELDKYEQRVVARFENEERLHIVEFDFDEIVEISHLQKSFEKETNVSLTDCSALYCAKQNECVLLVADCKFHHLAMSIGVEVKGILYIFDMLVKYGVISLDCASKKLALLNMLNHSAPLGLPEKRNKQWDGYQDKERRLPMIS